MSFSLAGVCFGPKGRAIGGAYSNSRMMNINLSFLATSLPPDNGKRYHQRLAMLQFGSSRPFSMIPLTRYQRSFPCCFQILIGSLRWKWPGIRSWNLVLIMLLLMSRSGAFLWSPRFVICSFDGSPRTGWIIFRKCRNIFLYYHRINARSDLTASGLRVSHTTLARFEGSTPQSPHYLIPSRTQNLVSCPPSCSCSAKSSPSYRRYQQPGIWSWRNCTWKWVR